MSCDIHIFAERRIRKSLKWKKVGDMFTVDEDWKDFYKKEKIDNPFYWQNYGLFGFLADVRNYAESESIIPARGMVVGLSPEVQKMYDEAREDPTYHSFSYLKLSELLEFDYNKTFTNKRSGSDDYGRIMTYRDFLGKNFFIHLKELEKIGPPKDVRVVFWFDN